jgi:hypothetical protein
MNNFDSAAHGQCANGHPLNAIGECAEVAATNRQDEQEHRAQREAAAMSIDSEIWWKREIVPDSLDALVDRLCAHFRVPRTNGGTKGNTAHRTGRHRSREWVTESAYCTNRDYGTRDDRDRRGNPRHIRAFDLTLPRAQLVAVCRRVDAAVRAGRLPQLAEWFGTLDGQRVAGWFEGHPSSADSSHLQHIHAGLWTENADDDHSELFRVMTGEDQDVQLSDPVDLRTDGDVKYSDSTTTVEGVLASTNYYVLVVRNLLQAARQELAAQRAVVDALAEAIRAGGGSVDTAAILAGVDERLAATRADLRDAVADLGEGGATQVRADL